MVEFICLRSYPALGDLSRKPFCGHLFHPSQLGSNQTEKNSPSSCPSLCHPICSHLWPQILDSATETVFVSADNLETFQRSWRDSRSKLSQRSYRFFLYDGDRPLELVPTIPDYFLPCRRIHRLDSNLPGSSLSDGCHCRSPSRIWNHEGLFILFFTFSCPRAGRLIQAQ